MREDFAVFILSHGRADSLITNKTLRERGYTGKIYLVLDDEDRTINAYRRKHNEEIIVFNKEKYIRETDTCDNFEKHNAVVYARNAVFDLAKERGLKYFLVLDDDYDAIAYKYVKDDILREDRVKSLDAVFDTMLEFLENSGALSVAFYQHGDYIGGKNSETFKRGIHRKIMNSFFCKTDRPFDFMGTINEDVNAYTLHASRGELFFSIADISVHQERTQSQKGGLTDIYLDLGTYVKSFYSVIVMPSAIKISIMGDDHKRIHHYVSWNNCAPKIINQRYKKGIHE